MTFLAFGIVCSSSMMGAIFEGLYFAYTRLTMQQTWAAMLSAPLGADDVILGEIVWAATKALINAAAILVLLTGLCFAGLAMIVTSVSRSYDFFLSTSPSSSRR